jgi:hypothetical protein
MEIFFSTKTWEIISYCNVLLTKYSVNEKEYLSAQNLSMERVKKAGDITYERNVCYCIMFLF